MRKILSFTLVLILTVGLFTIPITATEDEELDEIFDVVYRCYNLIKYFQLGISSDLFLTDEIKNGTFSDYTIEINDDFYGGLYIKANDTWTYEGLKAEMLEVMTEEMALAHLYSTVINIDGEVYVRDNEGIGQAYYSSKFKHIIERTEDTVKIGIYDDPWDEDNWAEYEYMVVKKIDGTWKVVYYDLNDEYIILQGYTHFSEEYLSYREERLDPDKRAERTAIAAEVGKRFKQGIEEIPDTADSYSNYHILAAIPLLLCAAWIITKKALVK